MAAHSILLVERHAWCRPSPGVVTVRASSQRRAVRCDPVALTQYCTEVEQLLLEGRDRASSSAPFSRAQAARAARQFRALLLELGGNSST
jgi:hypothetical protein